MPDFTDIYVLMMIAMNPSGGVGVMSQEFYNKQACLAAAQDMIKRAPREAHTLKVDKDSIRFGCYPKYLPPRYAKEG